MSVLKYIIENCDSGLRYRINFTGGTTLDIDNVWYIECGSIENGCYKVLSNRDEILDEYDSGDCIFIEYVNCDECQSNLTTQEDNLLVAEPCYIWIPCIPYSPIYLPTGLTNTDYVVFNNRCYYNSYQVTETTPNTTSIGSTFWRSSCEQCELYLSIAEEVVDVYVPCTTDPREFSIVNAYSPFPDNVIYYPTGNTYSNSDTIYFRNTETGQQKCFYYQGRASKDFPPTANVEAITGYTSSTSQPADACTQCELACDAQDIIIYFDDYTYSNMDITQSESNFNAMRAGIIEYISSIQDDIDNGTIRVGIYRKISSCDGSSGQVLALSEDYNVIVSTINGMSYLPVRYYNSQSVYQDIYNELTGNNSRQGATGTVVWLTDTLYIGWNTQCWAWTSFPYKANFLNLMKMGWVNGFGGKQIRVQIVEATSNYLASYFGTENIASTPNDYIQTTWTNWSGTTGSWLGLTDIACETFVSPGYGFNIYSAVPCCSGPVIYVSLDSGFTPTMTFDGETSDGFEYGGNCYWFYEEVDTATYSGQTIGTVLTGDVVSNICNSGSDPNCDCSKIVVRKFINCCDNTQNIRVGYNNDIGDPTSGDGVVYSGQCWVWDGQVPTTSVLTEVFATSWINNICSNTDAGCETCPSNTPTPTITITTTPTVTPTLTPTATPTLTITPTTTPTNTVTPTPTGTPKVVPTTLTPTPTITVTPTKTPLVTNTPSNTNTPSVTNTPSNTNTPSITQTPGSSSTPTSTNTPSITITPSITQTPGASLTPTSTNTPTQTVTSTPTPSVTNTPSVTDTPPITNTPSVTNTPSNTPTQTPSVTKTPSVTPSDITCQSFDFEIDVTPEQPTPSTTPQPTPSPTTERFISGETVVFLIDNGYFSCGDIIKLQDCLDNSYYYVNGPIFYQGVKLVVNDIFTAQLNGEEKCVKFISETNGSSTHFIQNISELHTSCCSNTPTPTLTPTTTPVATLTPTPTTTPTNTATPTTTPSSSVVVESVDLSFNVVYGSGSTVADYEIIASKVIDKDLEINFKNVLYDRITNDEVPIYVSTVMSAKTSSVTVSTSIPYDYSRIEPYELSYKEIVTQGTNITVQNINRYNSVVFENYTRPTESNYQFISCCGDKIKNLQVDTSSKWVVSGYGVIIDRVCYVPYKLGGDGSDGAYYGPDIVSCSDLECPKCPSATPTTTPTTTPTITPTITPSGNFYLVCDVVTKEYYMVCDVDNKEYYMVCNVDTDDYHLECSGTTNNDTTPTPTTTTTSTTTPTTTPSLISGDKTIYVYYPNL